MLHKKSFCNQLQRDNMRKEDKKNGINNRKSI